ncbi:MAG: LysR family transcriptional regulator [Alphaproteobacteria bacterium]|nr:LysR family transcriptional regulator [Alphaproteobacteria bacterium]
MRNAKEAAIVTGRNTARAATAAGREAAGRQVTQVHHSRGGRGFSLDWDKLRVFHTVAGAGSFTHAGEELGLSQSAVSRQVGALEEELGVSLFHRHARGLAPTEEGHLLYRTTHEVFGKLSLAQALLTDSKSKPSGELRVTTAVGFGSVWLAPRLKEFVDLYPDIKLSLICDDYERDLSLGEADVAIRMTEPQQAGLVQKRLMTVHYHVYAAPSYIKRFGAPATLAELDEHRLIIYGDEAPPSLRGVNWLLTAGCGPDVRRKPVLQINNGYGLLQAVEAGMGIANLPAYLARKNQKLTQVLTDIHGPSFDTFFVYPPELRNTKRISVFRDFLVHKVQESLL